MSTTIPKKQQALVLNENHKPEIEVIDVIEPGEHQILLKAQAYAVNPTDWKHITAKLGETHSIVGCDVSGIVVALGSKVEGFKVGDYVSTYLHGSYKAIPYPGAFAEYVLGTDRVTYKYNYELGISDSEKIPVGSITSFEAAASVSLSLDTVAYSFYYSLGLDHDNDYSESSILIWSGSTAAGALAIQVAKWLGFKNIVVTASPSRFDDLKQLGATHTYDYKSPDVVKQIRSDFGDQIVYALDSFSTTDSFSASYQILSNTQDSYLDNLLFLGEKDLVVPELKKTKVTFGNTLVYRASGESAQVPAAPEMLEKMKKFHKDFQPFIDSRKLLHIPLQVFPKGLYGVIDALTYLKEGSYSFVKVVLRAKDTPALEDQ